MFTNDLNVILFGMRRSGQHAIINWLAGHFDEPVWFVNDVVNFSDPREGRGEQRAAKHPIYVENATSFADMWGEPKKVLFQSYEDHSLIGLNDAANEKVVGRSRKTVFVIVIRDPYNMFASRLRKDGPLYACSPLAIAMWKQYAREATGITEFRPGAVCVNYNRWFKEPQYRRELEAILGLGESDEWMDRVTGVGSSFSHLEMDGKAHEMDVFERWKSVSDSPFFRQLMLDVELACLSDMLFGKIVTETGGKR